VLVLIGTENGGYLIPPVSVHVLFVGGRSVAEGELLAHRAPQIRMFGVIGVEGQAQIDALATFLAGAPLLENVHIAAAEITESDAEKIGSSLRNARLLRVVDVSGRAPFHDLFPAPPLPPSPTTALFSVLFRTARSVPSFDITAAAENVDAVKVAAKAVIPLNSVQLLVSE
jgi:hypothetical protein